MTDRDERLARLGRNLHRPAPLGQAAPPAFRIVLHPHTETRPTITAAKPSHRLAIDIRRLQARMKVLAKRPFDALELLGGQKLGQSNVVSHRTT